MKITSSKLGTSHLSANDEALFRCRNALELKDKGSYEGARGTMDHQTIDARPGKGEPGLLEKLFANL